MIKYCSCIFFALTLINSCSLPSSINNSNFFKKKSEFIFLNFDAAVENTITEMLKSNNELFLKNTLIFVDTLENKTNTTIQTKILTNLIQDKISQYTKKIYFLNNKIIEENKKKLGMLDVKRSIDTNTAILLARKNNAQYYLRTYISGEKEPVLLETKLILVNTGEIIFLKKEKFYW